jgi:hypothetical protein
MLKNMAEPDRPQMTILNGACWITKATDKHSKHVILSAFFHGKNGYSNAPSVLGFYIQGGPNMTGIDCV